VTEEQQPITEQPEVSESESANEVSGLGSRVSELEAEREKYLELAQRTQADFENYRKRAAKEAAAAGSRAKAGLVRELLPVLDNLERALEHADEGESLLDGVRLVHSDLVGVLQRSGVEVFDPSGEPFDPTLHEALSTRPEDGQHPGTVVEVVEKGYRLNDTILRPARVVVSQ
jgi:molecular chaperone GrpE